jgi:MoxR-like ATPase
LLRGAYAPSAQDVADLAPAVLNHRMALAFGARARGITQLELIGDVTQMILDKKAAS